MFSIRLLRILCPCEGAVHRAVYRSMTALVSVALLTSSLQAGVFGDGRAENGPEDDRRGLSDASESGPTHAWYRSAGTLFCDGAVRGSATLLDLAELAPNETGAVIVTAAHVLFDLETGSRWKTCRFQYLGLGALPGYQAPLAHDALLLGPYLPGADPSDPAQGAGDWAFAWLGEHWRPPGSAIGIRPAAARAMAGSDGGLGLLAWDRERGEPAVSDPCRALFSSPEDLGGGRWPHQLLDDCDSGPGASGGALIAHRQGHSRLVAIRGGTHWDGARWPVASFPEGPPAGERWDPLAFTNYARALDEELLSSLRRWLQEGPGVLNAESSPAVGVHPSSP